MAEHVLPGDPPVPLVLRRSARARRITLRVSRLDGRVTLTLPRGVAEAEALGFARDKAGWLRAQLAGRAAPETPGIGTEILFAGTPHRIAAGSGRAVRREDGRIEVPGAPDRVAPRLAGYLKTEARARLTEAADRHSARLGRGYDRITLRDTRSRWGSCTTDGGLMFSWRLVMAPPEVLDYVAAHEVAHLAEMNHSPAFWSIVTRLYGPHVDERRWLRENGETLHRFRFR